MATPKQILDKDWLPTGIFGVEAGSAQVLASGDQSTVFDETGSTAVLIVSDGVRFEVGTDPTASATTHLSISPAMTLRVDAGQKVSVYGGGATISVIE